VYHSNLVRLSAACGVILRPKTNICSHHNIAEILSSDGVSAPRPTGVGILASEEERRPRSKKGRSPRLQITSDASFTNLTEHVRACHTSIVRLCCQLNSLTSQLQHERSTHQARGSEASNHEDLSDGDDLSDGGGMGGMSGDDLSDGGGMSGDDLSDGGGTDDKRSEGRDMASYFSLPILFLSFSTMTLTPDFMHSWLGLKHISCVQYLERACESKLDQSVYTTRQQLVLFLVRMKTGTTYKRLSSLFNSSESYCRTVFQNVTKVDLSWF
jgi:hypothetical protein